MNASTIIAVLSGLSASLLADEDWECMEDRTESPIDSKEEKDNPN